MYSGSKSGATTIEIDHEWEVARLAVMTRNKKSCGVSVKIDLDTMDGFRITNKRGNFCLSSDYK